jgi:hypothetical protein
MTKLSLAFLSKFAQKTWTEEEFEKVDGEKEITEALQAKLKVAEKRGWDDSASKVKAQIYSEVEKKIATKLGVEASTLEEMIDDFIAKAPKSEIKTEDIKNTDIFKNAVKKLQDELDVVKKDAQDKVKTLKALEIDRVLSKTINQIADTNKWDTSNKVHVDFFLKGIKSEYQFDIDENGNAIIFDKSGKPVRDELQNDLKLDDIIGNVGSSFFKESIDPKKSPENKASKGNVKVDPFKDDLDYYNRVNLESDPEKLAAMKQQYESQFLNK